MEALYNEYGKIPTVHQNPGFISNIYEAALYAIDEATVEFNGIFESIGVDELRYFERTGNLMAYNEADEEAAEGKKKTSLKEIGEKVIAVIRNLWAKVKGWFEDIITSFKVKREELIKSTKVQGILTKGVADITTFTAIKKTIGEDKLETFFKKATEIKFRKISDPTNVTGFHTNNWSNAVSFDPEKSAEDNSEAIFNAFLTKLKYVKGTSIKEAINKACIEDKATTLHKEYFERGGWDALAGAFSKGDFCKNDVAKDYKEAKAEFAKEEKEIRDAIKKAENKDDKSFEAKRIRMVGARSRAITQIFSAFLDVYWKRYTQGARIVATVSHLVARLSGKKNDKKEEK